MERDELWGAGNWRERAEEAGKVLGGEQLACLRKKDCVGGERRKGCKGIWEEVCSVSGRRG